MNRRLQETAYLTPEKICELFYLASQMRVAPHREAAIICANDRSTPVTKRKRGKLCPHPFPG
jgi:hypothetical protein